MSIILHVCFSHLITIFCEISWLWNHHCEIITSNGRCVVSGRSPLLADESIFKALHPLTTHQHKYKYLYTRARPDSKYFIHCLSSHVLWCYHTVSPTLTWKSSSKFQTDRTSQTPPLIDCWDAVSVRSEIGTSVFF